MNPCPRCDTPLTTQTFGAIALDGCDGCGGIWFDTNELNQLAHDQANGLKDIDHAFESHSAQIDHKGQMLCPRCRTHLFTFSFKHTPEIQVDGCRTCKGVWLDDHELEFLAAKIPKAKTDTVAPTVATEKLHVAARVTTGFLVSEPCPACKASNPVSSLSCWACGGVIRRTTVSGFCPRCDHSMQPLQLDGVPTRISICGFCKGLWFSQGELTVLLSRGLEETQRIRQMIGDGLGHFIDREIDESRLLKCPDCHACMERTHHHGEVPFQTDVCMICHGVWVDAGELVGCCHAYSAGEPIGGRGNSGVNWVN